MRVVTCLIVYQVVLMPTFGVLNCHLFLKSLIIGNITSLRVMKIQVQAPVNDLGPRITNGNPYEHIPTGGSQESGL